MSRKTRGEGWLSRDEKREAQRLHAENIEQLGERLIAVPAEDVEGFEIDAEVHEAVCALHKMRQDSGWRRQVRFIYKLMRKLDADEMDDISLAVERYEAGRAYAAEAHHEVEHWRDRLVREGDAGVEAFLEEFAGDRQQLRQLTRQAQREKKAGKPSKSGRALFKIIKAALDA